MDNFIIWCNNNEGFANMLLSIIGAVLSIIAIIVSIKTARLPYKKALKLTSYYDICFFKDSNDVVSSQLKGISVNAINIGKRNINLTFLGLAIKDSSHGRKPKKLVKISEEMTGKGIIAPTEIKSESYLTKDVLFNLNKFSEDAKVFIYASDSEGKEYFSAMGKVKKVKQSLSKQMI